MLKALFNFQQSSNKQGTPVSASLFLKSDDSVLLDSPATGPWMIVSGSGLSSCNFSVNLLYMIINWLVFALYLDNAWLRHIIVTFIYKI